MKFPQSSFVKEDLEQYAGRFVIPDRYFSSDYAPMVRTASILNHDEWRYIQQELTNAKLEELLERYYQLTVFDMTFLIPRTPINVTMALLKMNKSMTSAMKRLCNTLRDMNVEEYNTRVMLKMKDDMAAANAEHTFKFCPPPKQDNSVYAEQIAKIRRYLNAKQCLKIPKNLSTNFQRIPKFLVKRAWQGPRFDAMYPKMLKEYQKA